MPPTPDQNIRPLGLFQKPSDEPQWHTQVRIHEKNPISPRPQHPTFHRIALSPRHGIFHNLEPRIPPRRLPRQLRRAILAFFHDHQKLPRLAGKYSPHRPNRRGQPKRLVARGNHNTHRRDLIGHGLGHYPKQVFFKIARAHLPEIAIILIAVVLRCWLIEIKPAHFDEGINGWFADRMQATGYHRYDPENYHGPLHFYAVFISQALFGRELWALRLPAILSSILCVWAILRFRDVFGVPAARFAALCMAISPAYVFYGRYSIHESWQVLFCILLLHAAIGLWQTGARRHLFVLAASISGLILTKETYVLHIGVLLLAVGVLGIWKFLSPPRPGWPLARQAWTRDDLVLALGLSAIVIVFFYSGTFLDFQAVSGLWKTHAVWFQTGVKAGGHEKTAYDLIAPLNYYWLALMARYEWPALAGVLAGLRYALPCDSRQRLVAITAAGTLLAYSIIPYKTPWCLISIAWPFYLLLGALLQEVVTKTSHRLLWLLALPLLAASLYSTIRLNFFQFTDDREPYVYVQTYEDIDLLTSPLLAAAESDPHGYQLEGAILLDSYYPLPWILGDFTRVGYFKGTQNPAQWNYDFLVIETKRTPEIEPQLTRPYFKIPFRLRSGQDACTAYLATDRFSNFVAPATPVISKKPAP